MGKEYIVTIKELDEVDQTLYGKVVTYDKKKMPDNSGDGWKCWYPVGELYATEPLYVGIVRAEPKPWLLSSMERHQDRGEWVYAIDKPMIQTVALSSPDYPTQPDPEKTKAVLLQPGQGLMIASGVWHAVGIPSKDEVITYGFVLGAPSSEEKKRDKGWVSFTDNTIVKLVYIHP